ncbi:MAG: CsgG/HfaB family protein [Gammaproteobacteria bacterium]
MKLHISARISVLTLIIALSACSMMQMGSSGAGTAASGSAAGASAQNANSSLQHCNQTLGTVAIDEHTNDPWYYTLTQQYNLPSVTPLIKLIVQQSNCFVVVDRGAGLNASMQERQLEQSGELRKNAGFHKGQLVAADYTIVPSVTISNSDAGGLSGFAGEISPIAGFISGNVHAKDASTALIMDDNRSGVQLAASTGNARNFDFGGFGVLFGGGMGAGLGAYQNTAQGKVVVAAFVDAYNQMVKALQNYKAQSVHGGLGTGGKLHVQGGNPPVLKPMPIHTTAAALPLALRLAVTQTLAQKLPAAWQPRKQGRDVVLNNPAQSLTLIAAPAGMSLKTVNGTLRMRLVSIGTQRLSAGVTRIQNARITTHYRQGLSAWYLNTGRGIEQGFTFERAPAKAQSRDLVLSLALSGSLKASQTKTGIVFSGTSGRPLQYGELIAYDQRGKTLPAALRLEHHQLLLSVNTEGAVFPVTIDPLFSLITDIPDPVIAGGEYFGFSVALSADGSTALIGAPASGPQNAGAAFVFTQTNGVWSVTPVQMFNDPLGAAGDRFGAGVALSSDGNNALVGAPELFNPHGAGKVYVYTQSNGTWSATPTQAFSDPAATVGDSFGTSVAVSADGTTTLIGAPYTTVSGQAQAGMAYVYTQSNGIWPAAPTLAFSDPAAARGDYFGISVALSGDGNTALIGADQTTVSSQSAAGKAYVYTQSSGTWPAAPTQVFSDPAAAANDFFGFSVALSGDGNTALIGAEETTVSGQSNAGKAYVYTQSSGTWSATPTLTFGDPAAAANDHFGDSVALSGDGTAALIGAYGTTVSGQAQAGMAYAYTTTLDLSLALAGSPASVTAGQNLTYMLTVTNTDTQATATSLSLTDTLPAGMTFVSNAAAGGSCSGTTTVTCTLASLAPQATWQPSITVTATTAGSIQDTAAVSASQFDPNTANNTATVTTTVAAAPPPPPPPPPSSGGGGGGLEWLELLLLTEAVLMRRVVKFARRVS